MAIKGSPGAFEGSVADISMEEEDESNVIMQEQVSQTREEKLYIPTVVDSGAMKSRRDTIANFFASNQTTPSTMSRRVSSVGVLLEEDATVEMDMSSPLTAAAAQKGLLKESVLPSLSPTTLSSPKSKSKPRKSNPRDSIACFFGSPKYRMIITKDSEELREENVSMDIEENSCEGKIDLLS
jgi:hypothetical protein